MLDIVQWHLAKDKRGPMQTKDGSLLPGPDTPLPNPDGPPDKIIIFSYFVCNTTFISQVILLTFTLDLASLTHQIVIDVDGYQASHH